MEQAFEQLIEKLVAAVAEALVLYVIIQAIPGLSAAVGAAGSLTSLIGQTTGITKLMASMGSAGGANSGGGGSSGGADVPAYANGGIVTSAHIGIVGEAGPEAIIPLSRMSEFTGGAGGNFQVTHKVSGSDLLLVINRASKTQSRKS